VRIAALRIVLLVGAIYALAGLVFGARAGEASSQQIRVAWRLAAWAVSAAAFGVHIAYEHIRVRSAPRPAALRVASAAALGAFALAVAANLHRLQARAAAPDDHAAALGLSLVLWPAITALPAFVVALVAAALLARLTRSTTRRR
jgi:hypothetical protein